ncbi:hypothetical protein GCM10009661_60730 [Catellatospora chokoriensis]|uniref:GGDEF domain-containing protein n=1 Tax=Catellatospora chokoriensis TaxID=310353 RepID=A0A8J3NW63_9ACTN|nr:hypothetical protein Cch02nite_64790 [Catellatospora chokoriensis]
MDVVARLGGEEFGVLLPGSDQLDATAVAERLRMVIARCPVVHAGTTLLVTASIGVVSYPQHAQTRDHLLERADRALYQAKRTGRDRVCGQPCTSTTDAPDQEGHVGLRNP